MNATAERYALRHKVELIYRNQKLGQILSILISCYMVWIAHGTVPFEGMLHAWLAATMAIALARLLLANRYMHLSPAEKDSHIESWLRKVQLGSLISGLIWAAGTLLMTLAGDIKLQLFTAFIMAGMCAGALPVLGPDRFSYRAYAWPIILAVIVGVFDRNDHLHVAFSLLSILFLVIMSRGADHFRDMLDDTLRLEYEKGDLLKTVRQAREAAEQSDRAKTEFLANITHELRTPMSGILSLAELMALDNLSEEQRSLLNPLQESAREMMGKIENLIVLAALDAQHTHLKPAPFAVVELLDAMLAIHRHTAEAKGLQIHAHTDKRMPNVLIGDLAQLHVLVDHLVANAVKFTDRGHIDISLDLVEQHAESVQVKFSVADTGPGISDETLQLIGHKLTQADGSATRRHGGIGVGLPIARKLIELMGGQLEITSQPGRGSTFTFTLPFDLPAAD